MKGRLLKLIGVFVMAGAAVLACGEDDGGTGPDGAEEIQLLATTFSRPSVTIEPGTTVRWVGGNVAHTITPDDPDQPGVWARQEMSPGEDFEHTFNTPGQTYEYHCELHPQTMTGTITVTEE